MRADIQKNDDMAGFYVDYSDIAGDPKSPFATHGTTQ